MGHQEPAHLPNLRRLGFFRYHFKPERSGWWTQVPGIERVAAQVQPLAGKYKTVPVAPALKNEWRFHHWQGSRKDEQDIFGALRPQRQRSKVAVSWAYHAGAEWQVRGWVWLSNKQWADKVWKLLQNQDGWQVALRTSGELEPYRMGTIAQVLNLLEETR